MIGWTCSVFGSKRQMLCCQFSEPQTMSSLSTKIQCEPGSTPGSTCGTRYSLTTPVLGSSRPMNDERCGEYQRYPFESPQISWVASSSRGSSYSVMIARVARPCGRGRVTNGGALDSGPRTRASHFTNCASAAALKRPCGPTSLRGD